MMNRFYKTELQIPVRRYHDTFDDFFMNRLHENSGSMMDTEMATRRSEWENRLDNMKSDFFKFSPFDDSQMKIDSSRTVGTVRLFLPKTLHGQCCVKLCKVIGLPLPPQIRLAIYLVFVQPSPYDAGLYE